MTIRLVQVGLGGWGQSWATNVVPKIKDVEPVAWVDLDAETVTRAQQQLGFPAERFFLSLEQALETVEADAVLIAASLPGHVPNAVTALQAGKHVLVEKPFAPSVEEARQVVELAERQGKLLMVSQNYRFAPAVRAVTELVCERVLGSISSVSLDFRRYANSAPREGHRHYTIRHPLLLDMSIHHFDLMRLVLGEEPREVICKGWNPAWSKFKDPPAATAVITFASGTVLSYRGSWISIAPQTNWSGDWSIESEGGQLDWSSRGEQPEHVMVRPLGERMRAAQLPEVQYVDRQGSLYAFAQAVLKGDEPECSGRDNLKTLALLFAAIESIEAGGVAVAIP